MPEVEIASIGTSGDVIERSSTDSPVQWEARTYERDGEWCVAVVDPSGEAEACSAYDLDETFTIQSSINAPGEAVDPNQILTVSISPSQLDLEKGSNRALTDLAGNERIATLANGQTVFLYTTVLTRANSTLLMRELQS